jgi:hypothetical protein
VETVALTSALDKSRNAEVLEAHRQIPSYETGSSYLGQLVPYLSS